MNKDVVLHRSYQELAAHYGTAIVPARVRNPKDKSHAEAAVRMAETWILAALRNQKFFGLSEMREAVAEKLEELNTRAFTNRSGNRKTAFTVKRIMESLQRKEYIRRVDGKRYGRWEVLWL